MIGQTYNPDKCVFIANQSLNANQFRSVAGNSNSTTHIVLWNLEENKLLWVNTKNNIIENEISGASQPTYKVYTALLTQNGLNPPVATILENTIGDITYSYDDIGFYFINSSLLFTNNKTAIFFGNTNAAFIKIYPNNDSQLIIEVFDTTGYTNFGLIKTPIEIRVYN
jgi:hypothetical protein